MKRRIPMNYDPDQGRWCVGIEGRRYGLRCGESFEIYLDQIAMPCNLELDSHWYVIMKGVRFDLKESEQYMVNV